VVGRKRHVLTDTLGLLLGIVVHPADVQDRDGAEPLLRQVRRLFPFIDRVIGDAGYQGAKVEDAVRRTGHWQLQIVRRCDRHRFVVLPKRWIVERTLAWISRNRRLARDFERHVRIAAAFVPIAMIRLMLRRLARPSNWIRSFRMGSENYSRHKRVLQAGATPGQQICMSARAFRDPSSVPWNGIFLNDFREI
jgi:transposase